MEILKKKKEKEKEKRSRRTRQGRKNQPSSKEFFKNWIKVAGNSPHSKEASSSGYLWGEELEGRGYEEDFFFHH